MWTLFRVANDSTRRNGIARALARAGLEPAEDRGTRPGPGLVLFDAVTPELCDLVRELSRAGLELVLAVASSRSALRRGDAWLLLGAGASDVFAWDHSPDPATEIVARLKRWEAVDALARSPTVQEILIGQSPAWTRAVRQVVEVGRFTDASMLITGESGAGKELVARVIHALDARAGKGELVVVDCTTIVPTLSGSEFFGHEKGAFTGAVTTRDGAFALADGGTLFLDEIGDLPLALQAELLRVVQEGMYKRVGGNVWHKTRFRLLCATNRDLLAESAAGRFRKDLYYRIAASACQLPSLRERAEDIPLLARHFLRVCSPDGPELSLDDEVTELLLTREYPGNVRELRQFVTRIASRHAGPGPITVGDVPADERPATEIQDVPWDDRRLEQSVRQALARGVTLRGLTRTVGEIAIRLALAEAGSVRAASRRLGVTERALQLRRAAGRKIAEEVSELGGDSA